MPVKDIRITNFRNISFQKLDFCGGFNIFTGENAQGKTNFIEAVRLALSGVSHREASALNFVGPEADNAQIKLNYVNENEVSDEIILNINRDTQTKSISVNGEAVRSRALLTAAYKTIFFGPEDLSLIKGGPALRRDYLNDALCTLSQTYALELASYNKALKQKNALLKTYVKSEEMLLDTYDEELVKYGSSVAAYRIKFLRAIEGNVVSLHSYICGERDELKLNYIGNIFKNGFSPDIKNVFAQELAKARDEDIKSKTSLTGIHRDDIAVIINGENARVRASQGQQRSIALCLKLALIDFYKKNSGLTATVFLDDVMSELDVKRRNRVLRSLNGIQCFVTATECGFSLEEIESKVFAVSDGKIIE